MTGKTTLTLLLNQVPRSTTSWGGDFCPKNQCFCRLVCTCTSEQVKDETEQQNSLVSYDILHFARTNCQQSAAGQAHTRTHRHTQDSGNVLQRQCHGCKIRQWLCVILQCTTPLIELIILPEYQRVVENSKQKKTHGLINPHTILTCPSTPLPLLYHGHKLSLPTT